MSAAPDLISKLIRAANQIEQIGTPERKQLLYRAVELVRNGRDQVGGRPIGTAPDTMLDLMTIAASVERRTNGELKAALLDAANMIRTLKILLDEKNDGMRGD